MKKIINVILIIIIVLFPLVMFSQSQSGAANQVDFMQGDGALESWFFQAFNKIEKDILAEAVKFTYIGRTLASIGALIYLSVVGWKWASGDGDFETMPIVRVVIFSLILSNWGLFLNILNAPFKAISAPSEKVFEEIAVSADLKRAQKYDYQLKVIDAAIKIEVENKIKLEHAMSGSDKSLMDYVGDMAGFDELKIALYEAALKANASFQKIFADILEFIALVLLRCAVYCLFFIQKVWLWILAIVGPIAVGISLVPGFDNSIYNWMSKYLNISLYTFIAFKIINIGQLIIMAAYDMEINRLKTLVNDDGSVTSEASLMAFIAGNGFIYSIIFPVVAYLITAAAMLLVPSIADSVVSAGGASLMSKTKAAANTTAKTAWKGTKTAGQGAAAGTKAAWQGGKALYNTVKSKLSKK